MPAPNQIAAADADVAAWRRGQGALAPDDVWLGREWLVTDGLGGFGCGTAADCATRRYHGWLCAPVAEHGGRRHLFLARLDEVAVTRDVEVALGAAWWRELAAPQSPDCARGFRLRPFPEWEWQLPDGALTRALVQTAGKSCVLVRYRWRGTQPLRLRLRPLLPYRPADALTAANGECDLSVRRQGSAFGFQPYPSLPVLWATVSQPLSWHREPVWYRGTRFPDDSARGYDDVEDQPAPGVWVLDLMPETEAVLAFTVGAAELDPALAFAHAAADVRGRWLTASTQLRAVEDPRWARFALGADDFRYRGMDGRPGVIAGFPWFGEWGRDTFLALPGLTLPRGDVAGCGEVLRAVLPFLREGLLPNIFGNGPDDSAYDSADAALWFARAVLLYDRAGGDADLLHTQMLPALLAIAAAYRRGAPLGLKVDGDGLLEAGAGDKNATWMDARTAAGPVTPRDGQPVEVNALWCSLLAHACELGWRFGELEGLGELELLHRRAHAAFPLRFWSSSAGHLADRVVAGKPDLTVRPNMVLAAALEFCPMTRSQRRGVVQKARALLLTPRGLRTLAPGEPGYQGRYEGGAEQRDGAYHQGTAWPWLLGSYVEASLRAAEPSELDALRRELLKLLDGLLPEVDRQGLNHVSEVFDGDAPQRGGGTFAQAWNTGELLRARALLASWPEALELRP